MTYLKQESFVRADPALTGEEKTTILNDLSRKISDLTDEREEAAAEASENR